MKIVGCIIVTVFCTALGSFFAGRFEKKLKVLEEMYSLVLKISVGIKNRIPFRDIASEYMSLRNPVYICGYDYNETIDSLESIRSEDLCSDETAACISLVKSLGRASDTSETERICADTLARIKTTLEKTREECTKKRGLYTKLGAVLGLLVCITVI